MAKRKWSFNWFRRSGRVRSPYYDTIASLVAAVAAALLLALVIYWSIQVVD